MLPLYDAVIVGAGPAGGECARRLSYAKKRVLLVEKASDLSSNNYSTAGAPLETLKQFALPATLIGSYFRKIGLFSTEESSLFEEKRPLGVVFDFKRLRQFLIEEAEAHGAKVHFGFSYVSSRQEDEQLFVTFRDRKTGEEQSVSTSVLVDATGSERAVLKSKQGAKTVQATGLECLVEVKERDFARWEEQISFFLGQKWMPQGYSWIFPMERPLLKVGVGRYFKNEKIVPHMQSFTFYLDLLFSTFFPGGFKVVEKHGKTLTYTLGQEDRRHQGRIVAIGDAVSTINPIALEGIRHAMTSASMASSHIVEVLDGERDDFSDYEQELKVYFGWKWRFAEAFMHVVYGQTVDKKTDAIVRAFQAFTVDEMMAFAFHYRFRPALKFCWNYVRTLFKSCWEERG